MTSFNRLPVFKELETKEDRELEVNYNRTAKELTEIIKQDKDKELNQKKREILDILKNVLEISISTDFETRFLDNSIYNLDTVIGRDFLPQVRNALDKIKDKQSKTNLIEIYQSIIVYFSASQTNGSNIELFLKFLYNLENLKKIIILMKKNAFLNEFKEYIKGGSNDYVSIFLNFDTPKPFAALLLPVLSKISLLKIQTEAKYLELIDELEKIKIALENIKNLTNEEFYKLRIGNNGMSDKDFFHFLLPTLPRRYAIKYTII